MVWPQFNFAQLQLLTVIYTHFHFVFFLHADGVGINPQQSAGMFLFSCLALFLICYLSHESNLSRLLHVTSCFHLCTVSSPRMHFN